MFITPCQASISAGKASKKQAFESFLAILASYQQHGWLSILRAPASTDVMIGTDVTLSFLCAGQFFFQL